MFINDYYANCRISAGKILRLVSEQIRDVVQKKIYAVTEKNSNFIDFKTINDVMICRHHSETLELSPSDITRFKYASSTSVDVERLFSRFQKYFET